MTRPIPDKAEVALEYPDKFYVGTFERSSRFEAHLDAAGLSLTLERSGDAETRNPFTCTSITACWRRCCGIWPARCSGTASMLNIALPSPRRRTCCAAHCGRHGHGGNPHGSGPMVDRTGRTSGVLALLSITIAAAPVFAQGSGSVAAGQTSAQRLCAECHAVRPGQPSPTTGAPPFERIANVSGMTAAALRVALQTPHRTMPNVMLQPDELDDIVAYVMSLQRSR